MQSVSPLGWFIKSSLNRWKTKNRRIWRKAHTSAKFLGRPKVVAVAYFLLRTTTTATCSTSRGCVLLSHVYPGELYFCTIKYTQVCLKFFKLLKVIILPGIETFSVKILPTQYEIHPLLSKAFHNGKAASRKSQECWQLMTQWFHHLGIIKHSPKYLRHRQLRQSCYKRWLFICLRSRLITRMRWRIADR